MTQFWGGSITTYVNKNPSFRVYELDAEYLVPVNFSTYIWNITDPSEGWHMNYNFLEEYNLPDMSLSSIDNLAARVLSDPDFALKLLNNSHSRGYMADYKEKSPSINKATYCEMTQSTGFDVLKCEGKEMNIA